MIQLQSTYTLDLNSGNATLHVSQLPGVPGPTLFQPGPAMMFLVVEGVPSIAQWVMVGNGQLGIQTTEANQPLPSSKIKSIQNTTATVLSGAGASAVSSSQSKSAANHSMTPDRLPAILVMMGFLMVTLVSASILV
jgi:hypothetical protein